MLELFASYSPPNGRNELVLYPMHVNLGAAMAVVQVGPAMAVTEIEGERSEAFKSPLVRIDFPGGEDFPSLWANGTLEDIITRWRGRQQGVHG